MTSQHNIKTLILAAGNGKRMGSARPKVLHPIAQFPMIGHTLKLAYEISGQVACVLNPDHVEVVEFVKEFFPKTKIFFQKNPQGTAHAVSQAMSFFDGKAEEHISVIYGDTPLLQKETIKLLLNQLQEDVMSVLGFRPANPGAYGRLITSSQGLEKIVEAKDASKEDLAQDLCNSGVMAFRGDFLTEALPKVGNKNASKEYYLTDLVEIARKKKEMVGLSECHPEQVEGVNTLKELARVEGVFQKNARDRLLSSGVQMQAPETVFLSHDTKLEPGVCVGPYVVFGPGVHVKEGTVIEAFSHLQGTSLGPENAVGPFTRLRPGTVTEAKVKLGNFVEVKKSCIGAGSKVNHLSYVGDAEVGAGVNLGAGTITCNYDGEKKHPTHIEDGAFIGSNVSLVAPVTVGEKATVGAGSVITKSVAPGALSLERSPQQTYPEKSNRLKAS